MRAHKNSKTTISALLLLAFTLPATAVMIAGPDGTINTNAPVGDQGWSYVGRISNKPSSVTYIGRSWFITAHHIKVLDNPTAVLFDGQSFSIDDTSWTRLTNTVDGSDADLQLFRVTMPIPYTNLTVVSSTPIPDTPVTMVGNGLNRGAPKTVGPLTKGYFWGSGTTKRWGTNTVFQTTTSTDIGYGSTTSFTTDWDNTPGEAHAVTYDSGGGVFVNNGGSWELAGIMIATESLTDGGGTYSLFGHQTSIADLSAYHQQITNTVAHSPAFWLTITNLYFSASNQTAHVEWDAQNNVTYQLQSTTNLLMTNSWTHVGAPVIGPNHTQTNSADPATQFYRVIAP